jgi:hypothetical protein
VTEVVECASGHNVHVADEFPIPVDTRSHLPVALAVEQSIYVHVLFLMSSTRHGLVTHAGQGARPLGGSLGIPTCPAAPPGSSAPRRPVRRAR